MVVVIITIVNFWLWPIRPQLGHCCWNVRYWQKRWRGRRQYKMNSSSFNSLFSHLRIVFCSHCIRNSNWPTLSLNVKSLWPFTYRFFETFLYTLVITYFILTQLKNHFGLFLLHVTKVSSFFLASLTVLNYHSRAAKKT